MDHLRLRRQEVKKKGDIVPVDFVWGQVQNQHTVLLRMSSDCSHDGRAGASMPGGDVRGSQDTSDTSGAPLPHPTISQLVERRNTAIERFVRIERHFNSVLMSRAKALAERERIDRSFEEMC